MQKYKLLCNKRVIEKCSRSGGVFYFICQYTYKGMTLQFIYGLFLLKNLYLCFKVIIFEIVYFKCYDKNNIKYVHNLFYGLNNCELLKT